MRNDEPSRDWLRRAVRSYAEHGGWCGQATLRHARRELEELYRHGVHAKAAGSVAARFYRLHSDIDYWREMADGVGADPPVEVGANAG
jgi:hypothetical protein